MPALRGGGEYGEDWHEAGTKLKKQNVFDDFYAVGRVARGERLDVEVEAGQHAAASNGGLLVGAVHHPAPRPLRRGGAGRRASWTCSASTSSPIGWGWTVGLRQRPRTPQEFEALRAYSPLHNVKPGTQLPGRRWSTTADHDDRVVPAHSYKFIAALQAAQAGAAPVLIRIETQAGHGAGKPTTKVIDEAPTASPSSLDDAR